MPAFPTSHRLFAAIVAASLPLGSVALTGQAGPYGGESPQAVVAAVAKAMERNDMVAAMPYLSPAGRVEIAKEGITGLMMVVNFANPDDPMPGGKTPPKAELDKKRKNYAEALAQVKACLAPHGLDSLIGKPPLSSEVDKTITAALAKTDTVALTQSLFRTMDSVGPLLGMKKGENAQPPINVGTVKEYIVKGDRAEAKAGDDTITFQRIEGRWYMTPPEKK